MDTFTWICLSTLALVFYYYWVFVAERPKLYSMNTEMKKFLETLPILKERYFPSFFFWEGKLQTALGDNRRTLSCSPLKFISHIFRLRDGGQLGLKILHPEDTLRVSPPVVLFLPGITGCVDYPYVQSFAKAIQNAGAITVIFTNRGFDGVPITTPKTHSSRDTGDIREVAAYLKKSYADSLILAFGLSFGGLLLGHYMLDCPKEAAETFKAMFLISAVWNNYNAMHNLEKTSINRIFNKNITYNLLRAIIGMEGVLKKRTDLFDWAAIESSRTIRDIERSLNVVQYGYGSVEEYWTDSILKGRAHFPLPVFALHAIDDPLIPGSDLPFDEAMAEGSNLALIVTKRGGHLGFLEGMCPRAKEQHYLERFTTEVIQVITSNSNGAIGNFK